MTEADSEDRSLPCQLANTFMSVGDRFGIAGAVRQENTIRLKRKYILCAGFRRHDSHAAALINEHPQDVLLDAIVIGNDMQCALRIEVFYRLPRICDDRTLIP